MRILSEFFLLFMKFSYELLNFCEFSAFLAKNWNFSLNYWIQLSQNFKLLSVKSSTYPPRSPNNPQSTQTSPQHIYMQIWKKFSFKELFFSQIFLFCDMTWQKHFYAALKQKQLAKMLYMCIMFSIWESFFYWCGF